MQLNFGQLLLIIFSCRMTCWETIYFHIFKLIDGVIKKLLKNNMVFSNYETGYLHVCFVHLGPISPNMKPMRRKRKNIIQVFAHSKENDIMSGEPSANKPRALQLPTSSYTNLVIPSVLEQLSSFRIKTKALKLMKCNFNQNSFEFIMNVSFLKFLNVKNQIKTWP